jgi:hypothetical protein
MKKFSGWFWPLTDPPPPTLDAWAVATPTGEQEQGFPVWRMLVQFRHPNADEDAIYAFRCVGEEPPPASSLVGYYFEHPEEFIFLDFVPNPKKK